MSFAFVSQAFGLQPRSQKQVFTYADAATATIEPPPVAERGGWAIHPVYLFFLAALLHEAGVTVFDEFVAGGNERAELLKQVGVRGEIKFPKRDANGEIATGRMPRTELFLLYSNLSTTAKKTLDKQTVRALNDVFPAAISLQLSKEVGDRLSIRSYAALIRTAGGVRAEP